MPRHHSETRTTCRLPVCPIAPTVWGWGLTAVCVGTLALSSYAGKGQEPKASPKPAKAGSMVGNSVAGLSLDDARAFAERFEKELWPVIQRSCMGCHGDTNSSQLTIAHDPKAAFLQMLADGRFDADNHSALDARVTTTDQQILIVALCELL